MTRINSLPAHLHLSSFLRREVRRKTLEKKTGEVARSSLAQSNVTQGSSRTITFELKKKK